MSRLNSFLNRLTAQKKLIEHAAPLIDGVDGPIVDLGLGSGRSYDHLRQNLPDRSIFAFDRRVDAPPGFIPDAHHMIVGEIRETLQYCQPRIGTQAALIHNDLGTGDDLANFCIAQWLGPLTNRLVATGGVILTSFPMDLPRCSPLPLPTGIGQNRYHIYRCISE